MKKFVPVFTFFIMIGVIAIGLNAIFGGGTITFVERVRINEIWVYKYNVWGYLSEVKNSLQNTANLQLEWQSLTWETMTATNFGTALGNNLAYIANIIIFALNIILYPIRIGAYALTIIGSILGLPVLTYSEDNPLAWLYITIDFISQFQIPYIEI